MLHGTGTSCRGSPPVRTIHWPKVMASAWPLSIIPADHRVFLLTVRNRPWTQMRRASPPICIQRHSVARCTRRFQTGRSGARAEVRTPVLRPPAAAACAAWRGAAAGLLFPGMPAARLPPPGRAGVGDNRGRTPAPGTQGGLSTSVSVARSSGKPAASGRMLRRLHVLCPAFNRVVPDSVNRAW